MVGVWTAVPRLWWAPSGVTVEKAYFFYEIYGINFLRYSKGFTCGKVIIN